MKANATNDATQQIDVVELAQTLQIGLSQLNAMLFATYGESGECLRGLRDDIQDYFMWGLQQKAAELAEMAETLLLKAMESPSEVGHE